MDLSATMTATQGVWVKIIGQAQMATETDPISPHSRHRLHQRKNQIHPETSISSKMVGQSKISQLLIYHAGR